MKELFLILLFGKTLLLSSSNVIDSQGVVFHLKKPISAITAGASMQIDVTNNIKIAEDIITLSMEAREFMRDGYVKAFLYDEEGLVTELSYRGDISVSREGVRIILDSVTGTPVGRKWEKVKITSSLPLKKVDVYWSNYKF